jgi:hypothetical protein
MKTQTKSQEWRSLYMLIYINFNFDFLGLDNIYS